MPFPNPKSGNEVMWNVQTHNHGTAVDFRAKTHNVDASGRAVLTPDFIGSL